MKTFCLLIQILLILNLFGQEQSKDMQYDKNNKLYYKISNDEDNLYIEIYKDRHAYKAVTVGGIIYHFKTVDADTSKSLSIQYPVYQRPRSFETIRIKNLKGAADGDYSIMNPYGIEAKADFQQRESTGEYRNDQLFSSTIQIPLEYIDGHKIAINIQLKGFRTIALPPNAVSPILVSTTLGGNDPIRQEYLLDMDTWTDSWISYDIVK